MSVSRVHTCKEQVKIAEGSAWPPAPKCRCRKYISLRRATKMVKEGEASWVVTSRIEEGQEVLCRLCKGDPEFKKCASCRGTGKEIANETVEEFGNDLVLVSRPPADKKEKKRSSALAKKTPRTATVEMGHIQNAYSDGLTKAFPRQWDKKNEARDRIEEYGRLYREMLASLIVGFEPEDDPEKGVGRGFDYGRSI